MDVLMAHGQEFLWLVIKLSAPFAAMALGVGLISGVAQAATGVSDTVWSQVPRLCLSLLLVMALWPWMSGAVADFTKNVFLLLPALQR